MKRIIAAAGLALAVLIAAHGNSIYQAGDLVGAGVMLIPLVISVLPAAMVATGGGSG